MSEILTPKISKPVSLWRQIQRNNFTHWNALADFLQLSNEQRQLALKNPRFSLNLPLRLAKKIAKGTLEDPILRQFLPTVEEEKISPGFVVDPVGDETFRKETKLLHKYEGRVLLVCTSACAMHCRYCFRQNFDYEGEDKTFSKELAMIEQDSSIHEVILSGGDPLSLSDNVLETLLQKISIIPHIKRIRFHTRFPMGIPERIDSSFLKILSEIPTQIWFVIHANHPSEFDDEIFSRLKALQKLGIPVMNQAVLLRGVNDNADTLKELCELLVNHGIAPYYLHQLDRVQGAAHFEVTEEEGHLFLKNISGRLPGYAIPKYAKEIPGESAKTILKN